MRAVTFSFVDQSSSRGLKKFGEKIPTSPISPDVINVHVSCVAFKLNNANKKYTNKSIIVVVTLA